MPAKPGDRVVHPLMPELGVGEILSASAEGKVRVYFVYGGEKVFKGAPLEIVSGDRAQHPLLDHRKLDAPAKGVTRRTVPEAIANFLALFPAGFRDPRYLAEERNYKVEAHALMTELLGADVLPSLVDREAFDEVVARSLRVVNKSNLIYPNEKMAFRDGLTPSTTARFSLALHDLLYGSADEQHRFGAWTNVLLDMNAAKWTIATYFPFLGDPDRYMFCKPMVTQAAADVCTFELNYRPELNWLTYRSVQQFAAVLRQEIRSLHPRDMIDVQSFIWCIAPDRLKAGASTVPTSSRPPRHSPAETTIPGYENANGQSVVRATGLPGTDHLQTIYVLRCNGCQNEYGANGSDIYQRKCPSCQGGAGGLAY